MLIKTEAGHREPTIDICRLVFRRPGTRRSKWVAFSLAILFIVNTDQALTQADSSASPYNAVLRLTVGVVFLGTPLRGSKAATAAKWRTYVAGILGKETSDSLIRDLDGKSGVLQDLVQKFAVLANSHRLRLPALCFYECRTTEIWRSVLPRTTADRFSSGFTNNIVSSPFIHNHAGMHNKGNTARGAEFCLS